MKDSKDVGSVPAAEDTGNTDFYWWAYDDGTEAGVVIEKKPKRETYHKLFDNNFQRKEYQGKIAEKYTRKKNAFEKNKLTLKCDLYQVCLRTDQIQGFPSELQDIAEKGKNNFLQMLEACGQDTAARAEVLKLVSALMAAYFFRFLAEYDLFSDDRCGDLRAPVLVCSLRDGVNDLLRDVVTSVGVDTTDSFGNEAYGELYYHQPSCLPQSLSNRQTLDGAYVKLRKSRKELFETAYPAQYRDTAVFLSARSFSKKDLLQFQKRNPWAVLVFLGITDQNLTVDPIRLDKAVLAHYVYGETWNKESVHKLVVCFLNWLKRRLKRENTETYREQLRLLDNLIARHNLRRGSEKIRGLKKFWIETQLLALEEFCTFGSEFGCWTEEESRTLLAGWKNLLLPGCCPFPRPVTDLAEPGRMIIPEYDCEDLFQRAVSEMLAREQWHHFAFVPSKGTFPIRKCDTEIWGYIRVYQDKKAHQRILTLQIREKQFRTLAPRFCPVQCDWYSVLKALREKAPPYLHSSKTTRMPGIGEGESVLILKADQLDFLPSQVKNMILSLYLLS